MKKSILGVVVIIILGFLSQSVLPWWSIVLVSIIVGALLGKSGEESFFIGFIGVLLLWGIYAFMLNSANDSILGDRIGQLFGRFTALTMVWLSALLGAIIGGLGAMTGALGRKAFE